MAVAAMLCAIPGPALTAQAPCSDVSGSYDVMVTLPGGGPTAIILELEQEECGLTGFVGLTSRIPIQNGTVSDSTASFTFEAENRGSGGTLEIRWEITISGDDVTGTFSHDMFGDIEVTGSRVPPGGESLGSQQVMQHPVVVVQKRPGHLEVLGFLELDRPDPGFVQVVDDGIRIGHQNR